MTSARGRVNRVLSCIFLLAAARQDADERQTAELRDRVIPLAQGLRTNGGDTGKISLEIRRIMGPVWQPQGQWAEGRANVHTIVDDALTQRGINPTEAFKPPR
ncbi:MULTISPECIES: hypothetical protein [unclassified Rhodococcus (in: high G+C Gram-positive bacteria)]|uniref:hypothetical protein n=1 Tax=unclassified Rhodococcus (in: high G+C Gram-positive bacteria) TaxID=192944 RepID=UPI0006F4B354|nr:MULTISPECIES: hypothetical protein [unclassified Rhodococcus (in: high G+C Gram-positive bacteria)]KQU30330.1 hypothetical protein ASG69_04545 [Rhodococcus sp. Leaf225]KQU44765.1 hypothetical protein ASH03_12595 [Rhodococcus sp. Leaf258]